MFQGMEWIILVMIVILFFGARKIPELERSMGRSAGELEKGKAEAEVRGLKQGQPVEDEEEEKPQRIAKEIGIETEGKTKDEIKEEISKAMLK